MVPVTAALSAAAIFGSMLGLGLWMLVSLVPALRRPSLLARVAPYVQDLSPSAREIVAQRAANPLPVLGATLAPAAEWARERLGALLGGSTTIARRLSQSGTDLTVDAYRARQLAWALGGVAAGIATGALLGATRGLPLPAQLALVPLGGVAGVLLCDYLLKHLAAARVKRMTAELPVLLEFLALSLSAGESIQPAIRRVAHVSAGDLAQELAAVGASANTGVSFAAALDARAQSLAFPAFRRAVDQIIGAIDRGSPLADVLRAQSQDAREISKRRLLEAAGAKEVAMLVPLVFIILPTTILFAVYPGLFLLQLGL